MARITYKHGTRVKVKKSKYPWHENQILTLTGVGYRNGMNGILLGVMESNDNGVWSDDVETLYDCKPKIGLKKFVMSK